MEEHLNFHQTSLQDVKYHAWIGGVMAIGFLTYSFWCYIIFPVDPVDMPLDYVPRKDSKLFPARNAVEIAEQLVQFLNVMQHTLQELEKARTFMLEAKVKQDCQVSSTRPPSLRGIQQTISTRLEKNLVYSRR